MWVGFGTYDRTRHPRVGVLVEGLRARGDSVTEVNAPWEVSTAQRIVLVHQPWRLFRPGLALIRCWLRIMRDARRVARNSPPDAVLVGYLGHFDVHLARRMFPRSIIVLDHLVSAAGTAADRRLTEGHGWKHRALNWIDTSALRAADVVLLDTEERRGALPAHQRHKAVVAPVGASNVWFATHREETPPTEPLRVVFAGLFTPLHGTSVIGEALALLGDDPNVFTTMIGVGQDRSDCQSRAASNSRVAWIDWVPGTELPALIARHDVSLGIFGTTAKAREVVPTKVYQGAAAGCAVITSDTSSQRRILQGSAVFVPPGDAAGLARVLQDLGRDRERLARLQQAARAHAVGHFRPEHVVEGLAGKVATLVESAREKV